MKESRKYVYHGSSEQGLKVLKPQIKSIHQKEWIFAAENPTIAAVFIGKGDDFVFKKSIQKDILEITERFNGALEYAYKDRKGSIYKVSSNTFISDPSLWVGELVSDKSVEVIDELGIENMLEYILRSEEKRNLKIYRYPDRPYYVPENDSDLVEKGVNAVEVFRDPLLDRIEELQSGILPSIIKELKDKGFVPDSTRWKKKFK